MNTPGLPASPPPAPATPRPGLLRRVASRVASFIEAASDRVLGKVSLDAEEERTAYRGFEFEADEVMDRRRTQRAQRLVRTAVLVTALFVVWAALARVDEMTRGEGKVIPSRQLQVLQSLDGGVVAEILVREGQQVEPNQLLLRIDETRAVSGVNESQSQSLALGARAARLKALAEGSPFNPPKPREGDADELRTVEEERRLYEARVSELDTLVSISRQQLVQRQEELSEARAKRSSAQRSLELAQEELAKTRPLLASGAVSEVDILRLERDLTRFRGEMEQAGAQIARAQASIGEAQRKIQETEITFRNEARKELSDVLAKLNALTEGAVALADKVDKTSVRSPVRGRVQRLLANTVGGVVQPGKDIVEIVPLDDALLLEARILPKDIAFIRPGQRAKVKLTAYDFSVYGGLDATVENISPDTVIDERGNAFYVIRVRTDRPSFSEKLPIIPGMTAEVDILTGNKTVLAYLMKPILRARSVALSER
ncbi:HlyD family type I secretion periplasmic adaptor subunit [Aquabacterium sp. A7-Y]|uniref:HlyD family type I secretion periplasmic adaptor subunit n=1 Tax=Aquabacterium sp. A7-Y TaxID=1349605 RepID=UPI00223D94BD|nr:HlyD family type I secretion periplasmic adaptor subunit [Aquabacterium sp. A7-Y]MCW7539853.1 HlyD family type I secretion periplasmic adaptor subunit [Aquabacterium sp. A7-Y]